MLEKIWNAIVGLVVGLIVWFGSQAIAGYIIGVIGRYSKWTVDFTITTAMIIGVIVSIICEIIYIKGKVDA